MITLQLTKGVYNRKDYRRFAIDDVPAFMARIAERNTFFDPNNRKLNLRNVCFAPVEVIDSTAELLVSNIASVTALIFDFDSCGGYDTPGQMLHAIKPAIESRYVVWWETYRSKLAGQPLHMRLLLPTERPISPAASLRLYSVYAARLRALGVQTGDISGVSKPESPAIETGISNGVSPKDASRPYLDTTSSEAARLHVGPLAGRQWGILDGMPLAVDTTEQLLGDVSLLPKRGKRRKAEPKAEPAEGEVIELAIESDDAPGDIASSMSIGAASAFDISNLRDENGDVIDVYKLDTAYIARHARPGEDKLRCYCPLAPDASSASAFIHMHHGVAYITCTSDHHKHPIRHTFPIVVGEFNFRIPPPYAVTPTHALVKQTGRQRRATYQTVTFTAPLITAVFSDDETNDEWWEIRWNGFGSTDMTSVSLRRDEVGMASKLLEKAGRLGLDINEGNKKELTKYLSECMAENVRNVPHRTMSARLGWHDTGFMLGGTWISGNAVTPPKELIIPSGDGRAAIAHAIRANGSLSEWARGWDMVANHPYAAVGVYHAIASLLLAHVRCLPSVLEWGGLTGTGKTVSLQVAASVYGQMDDMITGWDGTQVDIERVAAFSHSLPMFKDDTKTTNKGKTSIDPESTVYRVVSGEGRGRATPTGLDARRKWRLNLLMTGEEPIYGAGQSGGARARLISIQEPPFGITTKGEVSKVVAPFMRIFAKNYGVVAPYIVAEIMNIEPAKLITAHSQIRAKWQSRLAQHSAGDRVSSHIALMEMAARLLEKVLHVYSAHSVEPRSAIHLKVLAKHMLEVDNVAGVVDPTERAFGDFYSWALAHRGNFWTQNSATRTSSELSRIPIGGWYGRWDDGDKWDAMFFTRNAVAAFVKLFGYHEAPAILCNNWLKRGWLEPGSDGRRQHSIRIAGGKDWCYKLPKSIADKLGDNGIQNGS